MSPRSQEYLAQARTQLRAARVVAEKELASPAISGAYMAMLNAARAALSEEDRFARTHSGTSDLFRDVFVLSGRFDRDLHARAQAAQPLHEEADYGYKPLDLPQARQLVDLAEEFLAEVELMLNQDCR